MQGPRERRLSLGNVTVVFERIDILNNLSDVAVKSGEGGMIPQAIVL